jgi:hypothetical protein
MSLRAIHNLGVLYSDPILGNMIWNEEIQRVMFIDFERAQYQKRVFLGSIAANQKRKRVISVWDKSPNKRSDSFQRELSRMRSTILSIFRLDEEPFLDAWIAICG